MSISCRQELEAEWRRLDAAPSAGRAVALWSAAEPALSGADSLGQVLELARSGDDGTSERVLVAVLAGRTASGGPLARASGSPGADPYLGPRLVLQLMLPKIGPLAASLAALPSYEERGQEAVALLWQAIHEVPLVRLGARPAGNNPGAYRLGTVPKWIYHRALRDARRASAEYAQELGHVPSGVELGDLWAMHPAEASAVAVVDRLCDMAVEKGWLTPQIADMLALKATNRSWTDVDAARAAGMDVSRAAAIKRRQRAEATLRLRAGDLRRGDLAIA